MKLTEIIIAVLADPEKRARFFAELEAAEAARVAAMPPEVRARYDEECKQRAEYDQYLGERSTLTNGEIIQVRDQLEQILNEVGRARDHALGAWANTHEKLKSATGSQGGTDRALTEALARIRALDKELTATRAERDAARKAYLALLDRTAKAEGGK